jgi:hypothetical protein
METLERCRTCGASLSPDIDWCGQCYTPVSSPEERVEDDVIFVPEVTEPVISRENPVALSMWAKVALTILLVGFGALAFAWLQEFTEVAGPPAWAFSLFFLVSYGALAVVLLALVWRSELSGARERVILLPAAERESDARQTALRRSQDPGEPATE